jgi:hypothetical protein
MLGIAILLLAVLLIILLLFAGKRDRRHSRPHPSRGQDSQGGILIDDSIAAGDPLRGGGVSADDTDSFEGGGGSFGGAGASGGWGESGDSGDGGD